MSRAIYFDKVDSVLDWYNERKQRLDELEAKDTEEGTSLLLIQDRERLLSERNAQLLLLAISEPHERQEICGCARCSQSLESGD